MSAKAIETIWNGCRFRSRTEARWAVFFENVGLRWEFEREGFALSSGAYLPDFYLPELGIWFEVKAEEPSDKEHALCVELAAATGKPVMISCSAPCGLDELYFVSSSGERRAPKFHFMEDRRTPGEFWLVSDEERFSIGPVRGDDHGRHPIRSQRIVLAYSNARKARFEHGEKPETKKVNWW